METRLEMVGSAVALSLLMAAPVHAQWMDPPPSTKKDTKRAPAARPAPRSTPRATPQPTAPRTVRAPHGASSTVRVLRDRAGTPISLETATVRYARHGQTVDLIGAVHIGDRAYYEHLNGQFTQYDALLYELVTEPGNVPIPGGTGRIDDLGGLFKEGVRIVLQMEHQLDWVDYRARNFVHADLSPDQLAQKMSERGDDMVTVALEVLLDVLRMDNVGQVAAPSSAGAPDPIGALMGPDGPLLLKRTMAVQFDGMDASVGLGKALDQLVINDRNEAAIAVLERELRKKQERFGIFYGAAHLPDLGARLEALGFRKTKTSWTTAWDMTQGKPVNLAAILRLVTRMLE